MSPTVSDSDVFIALPFQLSSDFTHRSGIVVSGHYGNRHRSALAFPMGSKLCVSGVDFFHPPLRKLREFRTQARNPVGMVHLCQLPVSSNDFVFRGVGCNFKNLVRRIGIGSVRFFSRPFLLLTLGSFSFGLPPFTLSPLLFLTVLLSSSLFCCSPAFPSCPPEPFSLFPARLLLDAFFSHSFGTPIPNPRCS